MSGTTTQGSPAWARVPAIISVRAEVGEPNSPRKVVPSPATLTVPGAFRWLPRTVAAPTTSAGPNASREPLVFDDPVLQPGHEPTVPAPARPRDGYCVYRPPEILPLGVKKMA